MSAGRSSDPSWSVTNFWKAGYLLSTFDISLVFKGSSSTKTMVGRILSATTGSNKGSRYTCSTPIRYEAAMSRMNPPRGDCEGDRSSCISLVRLVASNSASTGRGATASIPASHPSYDTSPKSVAVALTITMLLATWCPASHNLSLLAVTAPSFRGSRPSNKTMSKLPCSFTIKSASSVPFTLVHSKPRLSRGARTELSTGATMRTLTLLLETGAALGWGAGSVDVV
mmetsp:Transcript_34163/g.80120  ORF Transcript_34163/g.80120 Transcript_34163/m.80120 type:complete len:227 (-) Transcript_34163:471-1151(-)